MTESRWQPSQYNMAFPLTDRDDSLLFNTLTTSVIRVPNRIAQWLGGGADDRQQAVTEAEIQQLSDLGFMIRAGIDELALVRQGHAGFRHDTRGLQLTIAPTLSCDFECAYCYQEHPTEFMSREVEEALLRFIGARCKDGLRRLAITWFGGEPLLAIRTISRLAQEIRRICAREDTVVVPAVMITNGWGLVERNWPIVWGAGIRHYQITLDGASAGHDLRRYGRGGAPSYDRIARNVRRGLELYPDVSFTIRSNIDKTNAEGLVELERDLEERGILGERARLHPSDVQPITSCSTTAEVFDRQGFFEYKLQNDLRRWGLGKAPLFAPAPVPGLACSALHKEAYVVSPTGALFKCWSELGLDETRAVGHVLRGVRTTETERDSAAVFDEWDVTDDPECRSCKCLPICGGGCLWKGMVMTPGAETPQKLCTPFKFGDNLERRVRLQYVSVTGDASALPLARYSTNVRRELALPVVSKV